VTSKFVGFFRLIEACAQPGYPVCRCLKEDAVQYLDAFFYEQVNDPGDRASYRQHILADCLEQTAIDGEIYAIAVEAIEREKRVWGGILGRHPDALLRRSAEVLQLFVDLLKRLRQIADEHADSFRSEGFRRFFGMISKELDDEYLTKVALRSSSFVACPANSVCMAGIAR
jgi:hypothetical protein